ncbi:hypothetical protein ACETU7_18015 [Rhodococcus sp. 3Y1]
MEGIGIVTRLWMCAKLLGEDRRRVLASAGADTATLDLLSVLRRSGEPYQLTTRQITEQTGSQPVQSRSDSRARRTRVWWRGLPPRKGHE